MGETAVDEVELDDPLPTDTDDDVVVDAEPLVDVEPLFPLPSDVELPMIVAATVSRPFRARTLARLLSAIASCWALTARA